jgi:hypothetical protein
MEEKEEAGLSLVGWHVVETIERMFDLGFPLEDVLDSLDIPTEDHLNYLLARAANERGALIRDLIEE